MSDKPKKDERIPDLVMKVDELIEIQDTCMPPAELAAYNAAHPRRKRQPREPGPDGRIPLFVDEVDSLDVIIDTPQPIDSQRNGKKSKGDT